MIRRFDTPPLPYQRYRLRQGAYAVLCRNGRILLTHQDGPTPEWQLPGGGLDPGESPVAALHREVREETGFHVAPPRLIGSFRRFVYMPEYQIFAEKLCRVYLARPTLRLGPPTEPGHTTAWMSPQHALEALANPGDRAMLALAHRRNWLT
ncbi:NUDIX domain-containing protein [Paracoccus sp. p3-h83]|uniref:NUDIX domain-containing protein n=1 Tax=Paracoccus sp. p3-h83 TaxID=3342805 RepID=UPI0035B8BEA4